MLHRLVQWICGVPQSRGSIPCRVLSGEIGLGGKQDVHAHIFRPHPLLLSGLGGTFPLGGNTLVPPPVPLPGQTVFEDTSGSYMFSLWQILILSFDCCMLGTVCSYFSSCCYTTFLVRFQAIVKLQLSFMLNRIPSVTLPLLYFSGHYKGRCTSWNFPNTYTFTIAKYVELLTSFPCHLYYAE